MLEREAIRNLQKRCLRVAKLGLGKGIDAVFGDNAFSPTELAQDISPKDTREKGLPLEGQRVLSEGETILTEMEVGLLLPNPYQPRKDFDQDALEELASSIKEHGIVEPIIVSQSNDGNFYIVGGERRVRAAKIAGLKRVPVCIKQYTKEAMLEIAIIENIQREDLNALEEGLAYNELMLMSNATQEEVANRVGKSRSAVANALRLLKLPEEMKNALSQGKISAGHARALLSVLNSQEQDVLFARIVEAELSVREAEQMAASLNGKGIVTKKKERAKSEGQSPELAYLEEQFREKLGTKVALKGSLEKGSIEISYFSQEDLDHLFSLLCN